MKRNRHKRCLAFAICGWCLSTLWMATAWAIDAESLKASLDNGERIRIIDIRDTGSFRQCRINGAISVPAAICAVKKLPPLGNVVVYGDGLDPSIAQSAAEALSAKDGITAQVLEGGIMRWRELGYPCTEPKGLKREKLPSISYQQLEKLTTANPDLVLVDLRTAPEGARSSLTDLSALFPNTQLTDTPFQTGARQSSTRDVYVLIDNGDGRAQQTARELRASGVQRFVILTGGETIIERRGLPGKETR